MSTTEWTPVNEAEAELLKAFNALGDTPGTGIVEGEAEEDKQFILSTRGYYDLRCYVLTGKTFPRTTAEFSAKMPKPGCSQLTNCDPDIYQKTMDTIVTIGSSCYAYHQSNLAKLVTAATTAAQFSDTTISMMVDADMGLRPSLNVMLDPKYRTVASQDDAFSDARELAVMVLTDLKTDANEKEAEIKEIVETMISFKETTAEQLENVYGLSKKYLTGPVTNPITSNRPYIEYLNAQLAQDIKTLNATLAEAQATYSQWEYKKNLSIGLVFLGLPGWIAMATQAAEAARLKTAYDNLIARVDQLRESNATLANLITIVNQLCTQCDDIDNKMETAINAMTELAELFSAMGTCYDSIAVNLNGMATGVTNDSAVSRRTYINNKMSLAINKLTLLRSLADEFASDIIRNVTLTGTRT